MKFSIRENIYMPKRHGWACPTQRSDAKLVHWMMNGGSPLQIFVYVSYHSVRCSFPWAYMYLVISHHLLSLKFASERGHVTCQTLGHSNVFQYPYDLSKVAFDSSVYLRTILRSMCRDIPLSTLLLARHVKMSVNDSRASHV